MKFCYLDESGMGSEPFLVVAGIIVDAKRMHQTKAAWADFLNYLTDTVGQKVNEFHTRNFYRGRGLWANIDGSERAKIISAVLNWITSRKHHITFSAIDKTAFAANKEAGAFESLETPWRAAAFHCILGLQKHHQNQSNNKGHTVLVFDREKNEESCLTKLVSDPPEWTNSFYSKGSKPSALDNIVDVPFFVDSEQALLIQIADMVSFILRTYAELRSGATVDHYIGESNKIEMWAGQIFKRSIPQAMRYPTKGRNSAAQQFWNVAPSCLRK